MREASNAITAGLHLFHQNFCFEEGGVFFIRGTSLASCHPEGGTTEGSIKVVSSFALLRMTKGGT